MGLLELDQLMYLDLNDARGLRSLAGISNLRQLKLLWLWLGFDQVDISLVEELARLEHLEDLKLTVRVPSALQKLLSFPRLAK